VNKKGLLQTIQQRGSVGQPLNRGDFATRYLSCRYQAGTDRITVEEHSASATVTGVTADLGSS
jgi:hypothetical protein